MKLSQKGSILIHVLVTGVIVATIAAGLMSVLMMQYQAAHRAQLSHKGRLEAEELLHHIVTSWNANGSCSNITATANFPALTCSGGSGSPACGCTCTATVGGITIGVIGSRNPSVAGGVDAYGVSYVAGSTPSGACQVSITANVMK